MEKRIILAFVLSFIALYAFRTFLLPPAPPAEPQSTAPTPPTQQPAHASAPSEKTPATTTPSKTDTEPATPVPESVESAKVEELTFDTPLYAATFSNQGAS